MSDSRSHSSPHSGGGSERPDEWRRQRLIEQGKGGPAPRQVRAESRVSWWGIAKRVWQQTGEDNISILAAGVAFYSLLSIFPALTALVSVYGLVADPTIVQRELHDLRGVLPADAVSLLSGWLQQLAQRPRSSFGTGLVLSLLLSLWTARYATGAMMTALNVAYDEPESRSLLMFNAVAFALTAVLILFGIAVVALVAVVPAVVGLLPMPAGWLSAVSLLRWPIAGGVDGRRARSLVPVRAKSCQPDLGVGERGRHHSYGALDHRFVRLLGLRQPICRVRPDLRLGRGDRCTAHLVLARRVCRAAGRRAQLRHRTEAAPRPHLCVGMSWPMARALAARRWRWEQGSVRPAPIKRRRESSSNGSSNG